MQIKRLYSDSSGNLLRVDTITICILPPIGKDLRKGNDPGLQMIVGPQITETTIMGGYIADGRTVATIEITGEYDDWDKTGPNYNITWATKTLGNDQVIRFNMSNLPTIGSTV
jgi:hypothetical protein